MIDLNCFWVLLIGGAIWVAVEQWEKRINSEWWKHRDDKYSKYHQERK